MRLYVGNLPFDIDDAALRELFAPYGELTVAEVVCDKYSGQSRGFGFVEFSAAAAAQAAIDALNGTEVEGRRIRVSEARPPRQFGS
jgi:RNA recognition motif-containing protein